MQMKKLLKVEWAEVLEALSKVPPAAQGEAWQKTVQLVKDVIDGLNSAAVPVVAEELRYAPPCSLCRKAIELDQDYVYKALTAKFHHYDCHYMDASPLSELKKQMDEDQNSAT